MVLEPAQRKFCALNRTSTLLWSELSEPVSPAQLADRLVDHFHGVTHAEALRDVEGLLEEMKSLGIVLAVE